MCGYTNSAIAEPSASEAKSNWVLPMDFDGGDERADRLLGRRADRREVRLRGAEDVAPAAEPGRDVEDRHDDEHVDQRVLDERDQRRRAQPGDVGVDRQHHERDEQRQVLDVGVGRGGADPHHGQHRLDADELQRDVRHQRQDAGEGHGERQAARAVPAADEVGGRDVVVHPADRPQPGQEDERDRERHDRVGDREEADRARAEHQRGHGDERVGGVEVAAEQEPGDERAEAAARRGPTRSGAACPPRAASGRRRSRPGDDDEQDEDDREHDGVDVAHRASPPRRVRCCCRRREPRCSRLASHSASRRDRHVDQQVPVEEREVAELRREPGVDRDVSACRRSSRCHQARDGGRRDWVGGHWVRPPRLRGGAVGLLGRSGLHGLSHRVLSASSTGWM